MSESFKKLCEFWDSQFKGACAQKDEIIKNIDKENDWKQLPPSPKLMDAVASISNVDNFLDYGCGDGWASIVAIKNGAKNVLGVDVADGAIEYANILKQAFELNDSLSYKTIDADWLSTQKEEQYNSIYCSNVLDVVPNEIMREIVSNCARLLKKNGNAIFSFNYYMDLSKADPSRMKVVNDEVYINDVLRLVSKTDEQWREILEEYFTVIKIDYFSWPGEEVERRRIFFLKKK